MTKQYAPQPDRRRQDQGNTDPLEDLRRRRAETAEAEAGQKASKAARAEAESMNRDLQSEIEKPLSSNPEEFVIRFLRTEGQ